LGADGAGVAFPFGALEGAVLGGTALEIVFVLATEGWAFFVCGVETLPDLTGGLAFDADGFFFGAGAGLALATGFLGAGFLATTFAGGFLAGGAAFLAGAFDFGRSGAFFATGLLNLAGGLFAGFELDLAAGFEGFATFFAALDLAAGRDGLFEEVVFVFNLLSVRPGEKAVEHPPRGS
jgi:hypothetical protein